MTRLRTLVALLVLSLAPVACGGDANEAEPFTSTEGRFTAEFPTEPERQEQNQTVVGVPLRIITFTSEEGDGAVGVGYVDYPPSVTAAGARPVLDGVPEGAAANTQGTVVSERPTTFLGNEATDYVVRVRQGKGTATARAFLAGNRLYILQAVEEGQRTRSERFDRLVASFKLL